MERSFYNRVSELGYSDILIEIPKDRTGVVVELQQIEEKDYMARLKQYGMRQFIKYGIACYKKDCKVMIGDDSDNT
mgnify:CR=1 FL=1